MPSYPSFSLPPRSSFLPKKGKKKKGKRRSLFDKKEYLYPVAGFGEMFGNIFGVGKAKAKRSKPRKTKKRGKRK